MIQPDVGPLPRPRVDCLPDIPHGMEWTPTEVEGVYRLQCITVALTRVACEELADGKFALVLRALGGDDFVIQIDAPTTAEAMRVLKSEYGFQRAVILDDEGNLHDPGRWFLYSRLDLHLHDFLGRHG